MKNDPIIINEQNLNTLEAKYESTVAAIDKVNAKVYKWGTTPESQVNLSAPLPLRVGGGHFDQGLALSAAVEKVRGALVERLTGARRDTQALQYAVKWLLADSHATEHLATLSGADFEHFIPTGTK